MTTGLGSLTVKIGFGYGALDTAAVLTDVSADVLHVTTSSGRPSPFQPFAPATAEILLDNLARHYDAAYAAGPHYGALRPLLQVQIAANDSGSTNRKLYTGFILPPPDGYSYDYPDGRDATTTIRCADGLTILEAFQLLTLDTPAYGAELTGPRVTRVLDAAGWPAAWRTIAAGQVLLQDTAYGQSAAEHLRRVAATEVGALYLDAAGLATFDDRHTVLTAARMTTPQATFSDTGSNVDMRVIGWDFGGELRNHWQIAREGGPTQETSDATSIAANGDQQFTDLALLMQNDPDAEAIAEWGTKAWKDALFAPKVIEIEATDDPTALDQALQRKLRDRVTVTWTPPGGGAQNSSDAFIERITHDIPVRDNPGFWTTRFGLSSANRYSFTNAAQYLKLNDASLGKLDTAHLAF